MAPMRLFVLFLVVLLLIGGGMLVPSLVWYPPLFQVEYTWTPGAMTSTADPKSLKKANLSSQ